ncbi:MAG: hypothetical protein ACTHL1_04455 [Burkholderiaceae bacterium]
MKPSPDSKKPNLLTRVARTYSGGITPTALSALSAWLIVTGLKGLAGFTVNQQTALADLIGIVIVLGLVRWVKVKYDVK